MERTYYLIGGGTAVSGREERVCQERVSGGSTATAGAGHVAIVDSEDMVRILCDLIRIFK